MNINELKDRVKVGVQAGPGPKIAPKAPSVPKAPSQASQASQASQDGTVGPKKGTTKKKEDHPSVSDAIVIQKAFELLPKDKAISILNEITKRREMYYHKSAFEKFLDGVHTALLLCCDDTRHEDLGS